MAPWGMIIENIVKHVANIGKGAAKAGLAGRNKKRRRAGISEAIFGGLVPTNTQGMFDKGGESRLPVTQPNRIQASADTYDIGKTDKFNEDRLAETYQNRMRMLSEMDKGLTPMKKLEEEEEEYE